jgi:hypothetical protein
MPIKSKAQRRKFAELLIKGEISAETYEKWNREAGSKELPERLHPKVTAKRKRATVKRKRATKSKRPAKSKSARAKKSSRSTRKRGRSA